MKVATTARPSFTKWQPIEIMLAVLFLLAPFYHHYNVGGEGLAIPNNITVWAVATIVIFYSIYQCSISKAICITKYIAYLAAFPVLILINGFIADVVDPMDWLFKLLFVWFGFLFFISLFQHGMRQGAIDRLLFIIVLSALAQAIIGAWQILLPQWLLWAPPSSSFTPYGLFQQINNQASYQVTAMVIAVFLLSRPYLIIGQRWQQAIIVAFFAISAYVVAVSGSRIGIIAAIICIPLVLIGRRFNFNNKKLLLIAALFFIIGGVAGAWSGLDRIAADKPLDVSARVGIYAVSLDLIKQKPLLGHGLGSFDRVWQYAKADSYKKRPDMALISGYVDHPHNEILLWLVEAGVLAGLSIIILVIGIVLSLRGLNKHRWGAYLAMLLPISLHTQVELPFYTSAIHWLLILVLLYVLMRINSRIKIVALSNIATSTVKITAMAFFCSTLIFLAHSLVANYQLGKILSSTASVAYDDVALANPYFRELVISLKMQTMLLANIANKSSAGVQDYIPWAQQHIIARPRALMFIHLAMAYQHIGDQDQMCATLATGVSLYLHDAILIRGNEFCNK